MRKMKRQGMSRLIAFALAFATAWTCVGTPRLQAMMAPSQAVAASAAMDRAADLKTVQSALENRLVRQRLADLGLTPGQINRRLSRLDDAKLHQVAMNIEKQNPAGDAGGIVITVLVIGILAALFVWLVDEIDD